MNLLIKLEDLTQEELVRLAALSRTYQRENPRKGWTQKEYKEAARRAVVELVLEALG